jgi:hypothetical protein
VNGAGVNTGTGGAEGAFGVPGTDGGPRWGRDVVRALVCVVLPAALLGLRLTRLRLRRIAAAEAVNRTSSNSFGYRGSLLAFGAAAVILRRGPALKLTLRDGKTFLVTVDDAATGAALLNDLIHAESAGQ